MKEGISKIWGCFLDIVFPIRCLGCQREGEWICTICGQKIKVSQKQVCPRCGDDTSDSSFCKQCRVTSKMTGIVVAASYEDKLLQQAVHALKYKFVRGMSQPLARVLSKEFKIWLDRCSPDQRNIVLLPVPLFRKRQRQRGFNQAALLAQQLGEQTEVEVRTDILTRVKSTPAQAKLDPLKRRKNIKGAFRLDKAAGLSGKIVFIIDDVCTTSATLEECAKEASKASPQEIWGLVLARGK